MSTVLEALRSATAPDRVEDGKAAGITVHGRVPRAVVAPASAKEAAAVLALASEHGWTVEPAGSGSALDSGRPVERPDIVLTTGRLDRVVEYEPADLTASVGAGVRLSTLQDRLRSESQWWPLDPPDAGAATVGAVVSTAAAGPLRAAYGTPRNHVLGLELVTGDGRILKVGGRVVKNVAGYDLVKPITGSRGTLGFITQVHLRLTPLPERDATIALAADPSTLSQIAASVRAAQIEPAALELVSPALADAEVAGRDGGWALLLRLQGGAEATRDREARVEEIAGGADMEILGGTDADRLWTKLRRAEAEAPLTIRMADWPTAFDDTLALARSVAAEAAGGASDPVAVAAHAADGIVRLLVPDAGADAAAWSDGLRTARNRLGRNGGSLIISRGPRSLLEQVDPFGPVGPARRLMGGLRETLDPAGVLAPGRYVV